VSAKLTKVLTVAEVAAIAGWDRRRMLRHLLRVDHETGGLILRNIGQPGRRPRWTVTLAALQQVAPQWFTDPESVQARLEALESETKHLRRLLSTLGRTVHDLTAA